MLECIPEDFLRAYRSFSDAPHLIGCCLRCWPVCRLAENIAGLKKYAPEVDSTIFQVRAIAAERRSHGGRVSA